MYLEKLLLDKQGCCQHRIGNSGADSCKLKIEEFIDKLKIDNCDMIQK